MENFVKPLLFLKPKQYHLPGQFEHVSTFTPAVISTESVPNGSLKLGLALYHKDLTTIFSSWLNASPADVTQAYHGAQLLSCCPAVFDDTLCACYYASSFVLSGTAANYLKSLQIDGFTDVELCRRRILYDAPDDSQFGILLANVNRLAAS